MAGFFDRIKAFFASDGAGQGLAGRVRDAMLARASAKQSFEAAELAATVGKGPDEIAQATRLVDAEFTSGLLASFGYRRLWRDGAYLYNPYSGDGPAAGPAGPPPAAPAAAPRPFGTAPPAGVPAPPAAPARPAPSGPGTYAANPAILGLSAEAMRKQALKIVPWRTAWIGRVDTIPPQSDERTALIDRGLVLAGYLTEAQLAEIHTVGDEWLKHHDASRLASTLAQKSAQAAIDALKEEKARERAERKKASAERAAKRAEAVARRRREDIIFLGRGVSRGLADRRSNIEKLQQQGLPVLSTPADVAQALGLGVPKLRWLCFHAEAAQRVHYTAFEIPKRSGGTRRIAAPQKTLKAAQAWVLKEILEKVPVEAQAHGFVKQRSTVTNAREHLGRGVVVNLDVKDFFPTIGFRRVRGVFQRLGYSPAVATVLGLLCTEAPRREVDYDGVRYHVAVGERALPQGACTSPALSNLVSRKLDRRLSGRMQKLGWTYTRYADDLSFSSPEAGRNQVGRVMAVARHVLQEEGFALNPKKGRVQVKAARQQVTGIVVNQKLSVPREEVRRLRAILHQAKKTGLEAQNREQRPDFRAYLKGKIAYVSMVDPARGAKLTAALDAVPR